MSLDLNRKLAAEGLVKVENSGFSNLVFSSIAKDERLNRTDKAFIAKVFYGTLERKLTLDYILGQFCQKPLKKLDKEVLAIMESGLYQILYMKSVPMFAAVNQAVELCSSFKKTSAKGLVNAVLRKSANFDLSRAKFDSEIQRLSVLYSVSEPIVRLIVRDYPQKRQEILENMFTPPALIINVNTAKIKTRRLKAVFDEKGVKYRDTPLPDCLRLYVHGDITRVYGFEQGYFFVQGLASRYTAIAAGLKEGHRVVDLCAAPGGKTFAAAILMGDTGSIISCDPNPNRLTLIEKGAKRLGLCGINTVENYGEEYNENLTGRDVVICDVPCSGIGIIPKKPDLRYKDMSGLERLYDLQGKILSTAAKYVKKGGRIVYSTCTINCMENRRQVKKFLRENTGFRTVELNCPIPGGIIDDNMVTFLPDGAVCDGFFIAVLEKVW